ncbi:VWA domain-containing protein [Alistipes sp.]|uniref:VWA domain-containing protein n=1 Tax=Alistipes sp. TaxID=1872444 RepID=UPI003AF03623
MYTHSITRAHRTAFALVIDGSGSMAEQIRYRGQLTTKAEAVAAITNDLLFELIERARRSDGVRDYYDIAVMGYSGDDEVRSLLPFGQRFIPVTELAAQPMPMRTTLQEFRQPDGSVTQREMPAPAWIEPCAAGQTPMCEALRQVRDLLTVWTEKRANTDSFPPVVFNITDGEATDCDAEELRTVSEQIRSLRTTDGNVLLINIHIAADETGRTVFFPTEEEAATCPNRYAALLYDCSSRMPEVFEQAIRAAKGPGAMPPFRGMSFNASAAELVAMLNIGSISAKTE